jgi:CheY-like chemotaxis protein
MPKTVKYQKPVTTADHEYAARCTRGQVVVIDDTEVLSAFRARLDLYSYAGEFYSSAKPYLQILEEGRLNFQRPVVVICDVKMPEGDGLELLEELKQLNDKPNFVNERCSISRKRLSLRRIGFFYQTHRHRSLAAGYQ